MAKDTKEASPEHEEERKESGEMSIAAKAEAAKAAKAAAKAAKVAEAEARAQAAIKVIKAEKAKAARSALMLKVWSWFMGICTLILSFFAFALKQEDAVPFVFLGLIALFLPIVINMMSRSK